MITSQAAAVTLNSAIVLSSVSAATVVQIQTVVNTYSAVCGIAHCRFMMLAMQFFTKSYSAYIAPKTSQLLLPLWFYISF